MRSMRFLVASAAFLLVCAQSPEDAVFTPGQPMMDTAGRRIYAGGANMYHEAGMYWLIGEGEKVLSDCSQCLQLYKSADLQAWEYVGCAVNNSDMRAHVPAAFQDPSQYPYYRMERPKIFKCPGTGAYMLWYHADTSGFAMKSVGVLTAPSVAGPYTFVRDAFRPDGRDSYDMGTFVDDRGDGQAYLIRSVENKFAGISRMNTDCSDVTGIISDGPDMEGQAIMRGVDGPAGNGSLFAMGSHLTGWAPNAMQFVATSNRTLQGAVWVNNTNPTGDSTSFGTQSTFIFPYVHPDGHTTFIAMLDRWNMGPSHLPGGLANMTNVWLPMIPPQPTPPAPAPPAPGWQLALAPCAAGAPAQQFTAAGGVFKHAASGLCVASSDGGAALALATCDGSPAQAWAVHGQRVTNGQAGASCLSFNNANQYVTVGNPVIPYQCSEPPAWNELWSISAGASAGALEAMDMSGSRSGNCAAVTSPATSADSWTINWLDSWALKDF